MGNAHRSESVAAPSLKDLHKLQMVCGSHSGFKDSVNDPMGVTHRYDLQAF